MTQRLLATLTLALAASLLLTTASPQTAQAQNRRGMQKAGELAGEAREAFASKEYQRAAELLAEAFSNYPEPNFMWNSGRAWELAERFNTAEAFYLRYLDLDIPDEDRQKALNKIARLTALREIPAEVQDSQDSAALQILGAATRRMQTQLAQNVGQETTTSASPTQILAWGTAGLGFLALGATFTLHLASVGTVEEYHTAANGNDRGKYDALKDTLDTRVTISQVLLASGIILAGTGGTLLYLEYFRNDDGGISDEKPLPVSSIGVSPIVTPDGAGVGIGGTFW